MTTPRRKPPVTRHDATVILRVRRPEKARWVHTAQRAGTTLAQWIRDNLNQATDEPPPP